MLIVNADDWGRSREDTDAALACFSAERITSVTAMVFMKDSTRAAEIARTHSVPVGLHLNLSEAYDAPAVPPPIACSHQKIVRLFSASKYSILLYYPFLHRRLLRTINDQIAEFRRLYGREPTHVDGHQHKHLNLNLLFRPVVPSGAKVRRSFSFFPGEKSAINRSYRRFVDGMLARRYRLTDYFFALSQCMDQVRLDRVLTFSQNGSVELMTHPRFALEFSFLMSDGYKESMAPVKKGSYELL